MTRRYRRKLRQKVVYDITEEMLLRSGYKVHHEFGRGGYIRHLGKGKRFHFIPRHLQYPLEEGTSIHIDRTDENGFHYSTVTKEVNRAIKLELQRIKLCQLKYTPRIPVPTANKQRNISMKRTSLLKKSTLPKAKKE